ncbi:oligosaccharide flippase family protein [Roseivirga misakiensis]|uniref:Polysaccharide biosynthesis protein C-terminal domain-containing protein n=1 Tax=Roseivirga misakiensis TaxID=1563681 RepID=A0A1E5T5X2_9BACT|nr:oligosaccharide flippase family protein [Roseivirga misakiensis]OEK06763.1 hypothetical protein BFP71_03630 [Roseivirga misakiensis]
MPSNSSPFLWIKKSPFRNFTSLSFIQAINIGIGLLATPIIFSAVGEQQYGMINLALSIMMLLNVLIGFGFHLSGPREIAILLSKGQPLSNIFAQIIFSKSLIALITVSLLFFLSLGLGFFPNYRLILLFSITIILAEVINPLWFLMGAERMRMLSIGNLASRLIYLLLVFLFVKGLEDSSKVNFLFGLTAMVVNLLLVWKIVKDFRLTFRLQSIHTVFSTISSNTYLFLSSVAGHFSVHSAIIILSNLVSDAALGVYSLAQKVPIVLRMIPVLVTQSILAKASVFYQDDRISFNRMVGGAYLLTLLFTLLTSLSLYFLSDQVVYFLSAGTNTNAGKVLEKLAFIPFLAALNVGNMTIMLSAGSKKLLFDSTWICSTVMMVVGFFGAYLRGVEGMAYALLFSELFIFTTQGIMTFRMLNTETKSFYNSLFKIARSVFGDKAYGSGRNTE